MSYNRTNSTVELIVTFLRGLPSGKAFVVKYEGTEYIIPNFAVIDDSEIWSGCAPNDVGKLVMRESIAFEKGLVDPGSGSLGGGIPMKRNKLPDPPVLMPDQTIQAITDRLHLTSAHMGDSSGWDTAGDVLHIKHTEDDAAIFDGDRRFHDVQFCACAPDDINALLRENLKLRSWLEQATKRFNARRRRS